jgi:hypothetical protein
MAVHTPLHVDGPSSLKSIGEGKDTVMTVSTSSSKKLNVKTESLISQQVVSSIQMVKRLEKVKIEKSP